MASNPFAARLAEMDADTAEPSPRNPFAARLAEMNAGPKPKPASPPVSDRVSDQTIGGLVTGQNQRSMGESAARGALQGASFGFGDEIAAGAESLVPKAIRSRVPSLFTPGDTYTEIRDNKRRRNVEAQASNPFTYGASELGGGLVTGLGAGAGASTARVAATMGAQGAISGAGNSTADLTKGDVAGLARDVATSAATSAALGAGVSKFVRRAPERVDERLVANLSRGEAGGAAKDKLYKNLVAKAGEEFGDLNDVLGRHPGVKQALATSAATNPLKGAKLTTGILKGLDNEMTPIYRAIDAGPAAPKALELQNRLIGLRQQLVKKGRTDLADNVETFEKHIAKHFGDGDAVKTDAVLNSSMLREMRKGIGRIAFKDIADANAPAGVEAKRWIYGAINDTIDDAGRRTPGVDVNRLKTLNKDSSTMIAVRDVLADRGAKAAAGRTSLFQNILGATVLGGGIAGATGSGGAGIGGVVAAYAGLKAARAAAQGGRIGDFQLARLVQAARNGSTPAQLGQLAVEVGLSRAAADEIARRGVGAALDMPNEPQ